MINPELDKISRRQFIGKVGHTAAVIASTPLWLRAGIARAAAIPPSDPPPLTDSLQEVDIDQLLLNAVSARGIEPDQEEQDRWAEFCASVPLDPLDYFYSNMEFSGRSSNGRYKSNAVFYKLLKKSPFLNFGVIPIAASSQAETISLEVGPSEQGLDMVIKINTSALIESAPTVSPFFELTKILDEAMLIKGEFESFRARKLLLPERIQEALKWINEDSYKKIMEARTLANAAEALIESYGQGLPVNQGRLRYIAATYAWYGSNPDDPRWIAYANGLEEGIDSSFR